MTTTTATSPVTARTFYVLHLLAFLLLFTIMASLASASIWGLVHLYGTSGSADDLYRILLLWTSCCGLAGMWVLAHATRPTWKDYRAVGVPVPPSSSTKPATPAPAQYDLIEHLEQQRAWSIRTFGPGRRTEMVLGHIRKEIEEVQRNPGDLEEWIDLALLAFDGAWRLDAMPRQIAQAFADKLRTNMRREWPDWRFMRQDVAIEHIRSTGEHLRGDGGDL